MNLDVRGQPIYAYTGTRPFDRAKPTVVFVHGAAHDHSVWLLQSRYFAHHGFNALAIDLPGHGRSGGAALASVEAIADWLVDLCDAAGIAHASIVGHSLGALAALACAARHPSRVDKLALLGPAAPMEVSEGLLAAAKANDPVAYELISGWSTSYGKQIGGNTVPGMWLVGNDLRLMQRTPPGVLHTDLLACNAWDGARGAAVQVRCPTLVVMAARDLMTPPRAAGPLLDALTGARVVTLADTGHAMMAEQPDAVLDALRDFL